MALKNTVSLHQVGAGSTDWEFPTQKERYKSLLFELIIISGSARVDISTAPVLDIQSSNANAVAIPWSIGVVAENTQKVSPKFNAYRLTVISGEAYLNVKLI